MADTNIVDLEHASPGSPPAGRRSPVGRLFRALLFALPVLASCTPADELPDPEAPACPDSAPGTPHLLADGFAGTEGITFLSPDGRLFAGDGDVLVEVQPDGAWEVVADVPGIIGLAWWGDRVIAATSDSGDGDGLDGVFSVDPDAHVVERIGPGLEGANFVTVTPWDTLIVSDPQVDTLFELTAAGEVSDWLPGLESPNGTAFSEDGATLWVASTYANPAPIWRVPVSGGVAGVPEQVVEFPAATVPDGVALGTSGALYVAQIVAGRIDVVHGDGTSAPFATDVGSPASLAFGLGDDWDRCSVYSTSLFGDSVYRVEVGELGVPLRR